VVHCRGCCVVCCLLLLLCCRPKFEIFKINSKINLFHCRGLLFGCLCVCPALFVVVVCCCCLLCCIGVEGGS